MFVTSIGALNKANSQSWVHQPRKWPDRDGGTEAATDAKKDDTLRPGVRRAAEPTMGKVKDTDPLAELRKEILGK